MNSETVKQLVGYKAVDDYVKSGMIVGLGTGSTSAYVVDRVGQLLKFGELTDIICIPTSEDTRARAMFWGIPLTTLDEHMEIDVTIDGADEVDEQLNLIKGKGGALLREKLIEQSSKRFIVVVGNDKLTSSGLCSLGQFPIEIIKFCSKCILEKIVKLPSLPFINKAEIRKTMSGELYETDNQNYIVDVYTNGPIQDPEKAAEEIIRLVGVVEHGLFLNMATECLVGYPDGRVELMRRK